MQRRFVMFAIACFLATAWALATPAKASGADAALFERSGSVTVLANCGDGVVDVTGGEQCDAGGENRFCNSGCQLSACGDDVVNAAAGEACEPGASPDSCTASCQPLMCGDGIVSGAEQCDDGPNNSDTEPGACRTDCSLSVCGDGILDPGEDVDPPVSLSNAVPVDPRTCRYDFTGVGQMYCSQSCGLWNGTGGCQKGDADAFCKLATGNPESEATTYNIETALSAPGICCPSPPATEDDLVDTLQCEKIGNMAARGVDLDVWVNDTSILESHGPASVITLDPVNCTNPGFEE